jgi:hypothetical protein
MKKTIATLMLASAFTLQAQTTSFEPKTGDIEVDNALKEINQKAKDQPGTFSKEISTEFGIDQAKVDQMVKTIPPADVYMIAQTAETTKKPVEEITKTYQQNKDKGWGVIAKEAGIKPGSAEFHALKGKIKEHNRPAKDKMDKGNKAKDEKGKGKGKSKAKDKGKEAKPKKEKEAGTKETSPSDNTDAAGSGRG